MIKVYDIETFCNCFTYIDYDPDTKESQEFVVTSFRNELKDFVSYLKTLKKKILSSQRKESIMNILPHFF